MICIILLLSTWHKSFVKRWKRLSLADTEPLWTGLPLCFTLWVLKSEIFHTTRGLNVSSQGAGARGVDFVWIWLWQGQPKSYMKMRIKGHQSKDNRSSKQQKQKQAEHTRCRSSRHLEVSHTHWSSSCDLHRCFLMGVDGTSSIHRHPPITVPALDLKNEAKHPLQ